LIEHSSLLGHLLGVRLAKTVLIVLLAFAWLPLSAHCKIETIPGLKWLACQPAGSAQSSPSSHCGTGCCSVESASYSAPANQSIHSDLNFVLLFVNVLAELTVDRPIELVVGPSSDPPPELLTTWQFVSRTALPARAPSIAS